jgi:hypothetical protein
MFDKIVLSFVDENEENEYVVVSHNDECVSVINLTDCEFVLKKRQVMSLIDLFINSNPVFKFEHLNDEFVKSLIDYLDDEIINSDDNIEEMKELRSILYELSVVYLINKC